MTFSLRSLAAVVAVFVSGNVCRAAAEFPEPINNQRGDYVLTPAEIALKKFTVPKGFNVSLFAAEPDVRQPIALTTDAKGRLWVAECYSYDDRENNYSANQRDRIVIYEDTDNDGRFDKRTVFWDKAWKLTSIEVGFGGVWALCAPNLLFIPDANGDDVPDGEPRVLLDGWDDDRIRHNIVNGLKWGPDGWLYGRHGILTTSLVGQPGTSKANRTALNCSIWRYHPTRKAFEVVCHGGTNPWGHDWDENGELFWVNTVIGHFWHGIPGGYFKRMYGEHLRPNIYEYIDQHADHFHWDTRRKWSEERTATGVTDTAGGGHAHCGMMIYLGDNWPKQYRGELFALNLLGRRVNQDHIERRGAGFVAKHGADFLNANDEWYRGIDLIYGPDGGVFIADWSDVGECHENDGIHRTSGRIWKVTYGQPAKPTIGDLAKKSDAELLQLQLHDNEWYARQARKVLQERNAVGRNMTAVHAGALSLFQQQKLGVRKLRALWTLHVTGGTSAPWLRELLTDREEHVRVWAVRLLTQESAIDGQTTVALTDLARTESSALVRLYLASALQRLGVSERIPLASQLVFRAADEGDHNQPLMLWYGIEPIASELPDEAVRLAMSSRISLVRRNIARRITENIGSDMAPVEKMLSRLIDSSGTLKLEDFLLGMTEALNGWRKAPEPRTWASFQRIFANSKEGSLTKLVRELGVVFGNGRALEEIRKIASDKNSDGESRRAALAVLIENRPSDLAKILKDAIKERETESLAVRGMAGVDDVGVPAAIFGRLSRLTDEDRVAAISTLSSRKTYASELLKRLANGQVLRGDIKAFHVRQIRSFKDKNLDAKLEQHWGVIGKAGADKEKLLAKYRNQLTPGNLKKADLGSGRALYNLACATCHTLFGEGREIAPDITGANRSNLEYLLENIVAPNAMIAGDFKVSTVSLADGRVLNGVVGRTTDRTMEIQMPTEKLTLARADVKSVEASALSLMPEGLLEAMNEEQARDLIAYLMSQKQVPLK